MDRDVDDPDIQKPVTGTAPPRDGGTRRRLASSGPAIRIAVAAAILGLAGYQAWSMISAPPDTVQRQPRERSFTVSISSPTPETIRPGFQTYGEVIAARAIDIRARVSGEVLEVSRNLKVGGRVEAGEVLLRVDPFEYDGQVSLSLANVADGELALTEAEAARDLENSALVFAREQLAAGERDLERARTLFDRGSVTQQSVEQLELIAAERRQTVSQREGNLVTLEAAILRQRAVIETARWNLDQARRAQANTVITAPFAGIITAEAVQLGGIVASNETLLTMFDAGSLNVRFVVSDQQYGQLSREGLAGRPVRVIWDIKPSPVEFTGVVDRAGAQVDAASGGVQIYARLDGEPDIAIRPGTFVEVSVAGHEYSGVIRLPETAIYNDDHLYVVRHGRMARIAVEVVARDGADAVVRAELPAGEPVITTRLAQAGEGVLVTIEGEAPSGPAFGGGGPDGFAGSRRGGGGPPLH